MNTALWITQVLLALFFLMPAFLKLSSSRQQLIDKGMLDANGNILSKRLIGTAELLGSIGMVLPMLTGILPILTPLAAAGFCMVMLGAIVVHARKKEYKMLPLLMVVLALSVFVAYGRFQA